jgi:hypothetical protein
MAASGRRRRCPHRAGPFGEARVDVLLGGAQRVTELGRHWWLPGGEERGQDAIVDFDVEDGELQPVGG